MAISQHSKRYSLSALLAATLLVGLTPTYSFADDDDDEYSRQAWAPASMEKNYSPEEIRVMAEATALKRFGPGSTATISEQNDGYRIQLRDSNDKVVREQDVSLVGNDANAEQQ